MHGKATVRVVEKCPISRWQQYSTHLHTNSTQQYSTHLHTKSTQQYSTHLHTNSTQQYSTHLHTNSTQQYSTHLHTNSTQNTENGTYITIKEIRSVGRALSLRDMSWHLPYN